MEVLEERMSEEQKKREKNGYGRGEGKQIGD